MRIAYTLCCVCVALNFGLAQELFSDEFSKGYVKDGQKYLVWQYFDNNKELELAINHTTGKLTYLKQDTTAYVVNDGGKWVNKEFIIYPIPIGGHALFYQTIRKNLRFPEQARRTGTDGQVLLMFEIDSLGRQSNYSILSNPGGGLGEEVLRAVSENEFGWIQAQADHRTYRSRFILPVTFGFEEPPKVRKKRNLPPARMLDEVVIIAIGAARPHGR